MRKRFLATFVAVVLTIAGGITANKVGASPADEYTGTHFGLGNIPVGCENDTFLGPDGVTPRRDNACFHMRTGMNGLDSSTVDVLIMVPASPTAARDMRIIKQAVEMWQGGIHYLASQIGVPWMQNMQFHISTTIEDAAAGSGFVTYPIVDPEIVIVSSNPVGGAGIGVDPVASYGSIATGDRDAPCTGVTNPFDMDSWKGMPGYDHHGNEGGATVTEDCGGAGGNICFAITPAIDPAPPAGDIFNLFDLVSHEFGHCLTIGHVGDGAEQETEGGPWSKLPSNDIMAYSTDPPGLNKCVSTLDVEGIAVTQSHYIDTNGDGAVTDADHLDANEAEWDRPGGDHFQVQHPRDHYYASGTGAPTDCPQPDLGLVPGTPTDWEPDPVTTSTNTLTVTAPADGANAPDGKFTVSGTVAHASTSTSAPPTQTSGTVPDSDHDATTPLTEITQLRAQATASSLDATINLAQLPPTTEVPSGTNYSLAVNGYAFDSFAVTGNPLTWDARAGAYPKEVTSEWDATANTVTFRIPRAYLDRAGVSAPYYLSASAAYGGIFSNLLIDDRVPDGGGTLGIAGSRTLRLPEPGISLETVLFEHEGGNHFDATDSTPSGDVQFLENLFGLGSAHHFSLGVCQPSDVTFTLDWTDSSGLSDLDMVVTGTGVDSGTEAASANRPETFSVRNYDGALAIEVDPYLIADAENGVDYTLVAQVVPLGTGTCGGGGAGEPPPSAPNEFVNVYLDDATEPLASQDVDTSASADDFAIDVAVPNGAHTLRVEWEWWGKVVATKTVAVTAGVEETTTTSTSTTTSTTVAGHPNGEHHPGPGDHPGRDDHPGKNGAAVPVRIPR